MLPESDKRETVTWENVDPTLLEAQRQEIHRILWARESPGIVHLSDEEQDALQGIAAMLDAWSDERYHNRHSRPKPVPAVNSIKIESIKELDEARDMLSILLAEIALTDEDSEMGGQIESKLFKVMEKLRGETDGL